MLRKTVTGLWVVLVALSLFGLTGCGGSTRENGGSTFTVVVDDDGEAGELSGVGSSDKVDAQFIKPADLVAHMQAYREHVDFPLTSKVGTSVLVSEFFDMGFDSHLISSSRSVDGETDFFRVDSQRRKGTSEAEAFYSNGNTGKISSVYKKITDGNGVDFVRIERSVKIDSGSGFLPFEVEVSDWYFYPSFGMKPVRINIQRAQNGNMMPWGSASYDRGQNGMAGKVVYSGMLIPDFVRKDLEAGDDVFFSKQSYEVKYSWDGMSSKAVHSVKKPELDGLTHHSLTETFSGSGAKGDKRTFTELTVTFKDGVMTSKEDKRETSVTYDKAGQPITSKTVQTVNVVEVKSGVSVSTSQKDKEIISDTVYQIVKPFISAAVE